MSSGSIRQVWSDAELDEALATLHSGPSTRQDELSRTRAALLRAAGDVDDALLPVSEPERPAKKRPSSWRWIAAAAAAALVPGGVVVATNIFVANGQDTAAHGTHASSDDVFRDLHGTDVALRDGQFRYVKNSTWSTRYGNNAKIIYQVHEIFERWTPATPQKPAKMRFTRTGEIRWIKGDYGKAQANGDVIPGATSDVRYGPDEPDPLPSVPFSDADRTSNTPSAPIKTTSEGIRPKPGTPSNDNKGEPLKGDWGKPTPQFLAGLPTDPTRLLDRLRRDNGIQPDGRQVDPVKPAQKIFEMAYTALRAGYGFGDLRVALCRALASVPGITVRTGATTADQRTGISYSVDMPGHTREIVVDPVTASVIASRAISTENSHGTPPGTAIFETTTTVMVTDNDNA